jgi:hypothetical protein
VAVAAETPPSDAAKRIAEAERRAIEARAALETGRTDRVAAEMAKEFALGRAEEEQAAREAAERAAQEAKVALQRQQGAAKPAADSKALADLRRALDRAQKRAADEQRTREAAEAEAEAAREHLAKEQSAKASAWKVIGQLTKQLKQVKSASASGDASGADDPPPPEGPPPPQEGSRRRRPIGQAPSAKISAATRHPGGGAAGAAIRDLAR